MFGARETLIADFSRRPTHAASSPSWMVEEFMAFAPPVSEAAPTRRRIPAGEVVRAPERA